MGISLRAYARCRGVHPSAVVKAIRAGRISREPDGSIDPERADVDWERNTRVSMATPQTPVQHSANADVTPTGVPDYRKSRAIRQFYEAKLAKLEIDVREGRLVDVDEINRETFNRARRVRDRLLMIPRRLAAQIAAEPDAHAIEDLLDAAFKDALEDMASAETTLPLGRKRIPGETNS